MKASTFKLIDAINREGLDNSRWGVIEDCESTKSVFGCDSDDQLEGQWLYIYRDNDEIQSFIWDAGVMPDIRDSIDYVDFIEFYRL